MEENKHMFEPNFGVKKFSIEITIHENCNTFSLKNYDNHHEPTYQEIVGALEIVKHSFIKMQSEHNAEQYKKTEQQ